MHPAAAAMDPASDSPRGSPQPGGTSALGGASDRHPPQSPTIAATHMARFEFSDYGTKVLMVEWQPEAGAEAEVADDGGATKSGAAASGWEVSWPGKSTLVPSAIDAEQDGSRRRVYFLLASTAPVPATVTITNRTASPHAEAGSPHSFQVKPLPAIFPEGFSQEESWSRGVLHTIWARNRVAELEREMEAEMRTNAEGVALEMAAAEKEFIVQTFLSPPVSVSKMGYETGVGVNEPLPPTPRSPIGGRLGERLKGLRLATSSADLAAGSEANTFTSPSSQSRSLSPQGGDIAVSSFSATRTTGQQIPPPGGSSTAAGAVSSLNAVMSGDAAVQREPDSRDTEDGLFALPISPRSPDMKKSPFSLLGT